MEGPSTQLCNIGDLLNVDSEALDETLAPEEAYTDRGNEDIGSSA